MNEPLNLQVNNDFFYRKNKGPNGNVEKEVNHLIYKSKRKAYTIYILQILEFIRSKYKQRKKIKLPIPTFFHQSYWNTGEKRKLYHLFFLPNPWSMI